MMTRVIITAVAVLLLYSTNQQYSFDDPSVKTSAGDTRSYYSISKSNPGLPDWNVPYHHMQRFVLPFLIGSVSNATAIDIETIYKTLTAIIIIGILLLLVTILQTLGIQIQLIYIGTALVAFNPYSFRLYIAFPGLVNDLVFVLGLTLVVLGLVWRLYSLVLIGAITMIVGRQTAILCIPAIAAWIFMSQDWRSYSLLKKCTQCLVVILSIASIYWLGGMVAQRVSSSNHNIAHIIGVFSWLKHSFDIELLIKFLARAILPFLMILSIILASFRCLQWEGIDYSKLSLWLSFPVLICLQPYLAGPGITTSNIHRLQAISLVPAVIGIISILDKQDIFKRLNIYTILIVGLLYLSSFHHIYSMIGPKGPGYFAMMELILAILIFVCCLLSLSSDHSIIHGKE